MRVLQLIDSLEAGGAERVAVNFSNGLLKYNERSFLCTTRNEGLLKAGLNTKVEYLHLNRTKTIDFKALLALKKFIKKNSISIIHAHSTSIFTAVFVKLLGAKVKLVWHDHYGRSEFLNERPSKGLKFCSLFINQVFSVNDKLVKWSKSTLNIKKSEYLPNFVAYSKQEQITKLKGENGFRVVCLANLRPQKDHINLIKAFHLFHKDNQNYTLHLVGKDFNDDYSNEVKTLISDLQLNDVITIYGSCNDTFQILKQASIGVLASKSEGLPLSLLEYGLVSLPVVATNVGDCDKVISHQENGLLIEPNDYKELAKSLQNLSSNSILATRFGNTLNETINTHFSEKVILDHVVSVYQKL